MCQSRQGRLLLKMFERLGTAGMCKQAFAGDSMSSAVHTLVPLQSRSFSTALIRSISRQDSSVVAASHQSAQHLAPSATCTPQWSFASTAGSGVDEPPESISTGTSGSSSGSQDATPQPIDAPSQHGDEPQAEASAALSDDAPASSEHLQATEGAEPDGDAAAAAASDIEDDNDEDEAGFARPLQPVQAEAEEAATLDSWNASPSLSAFFTEFKRSSPQKQKFMLKRMMAGREELFLPQRSPEQEAWLQYQQEAFRANFRSQVVEVRGVSKGTRTGGIRRFSAVVVVGNSQGTLGLGSGKASELQAAVAKANMRALKTLFFVPRYCDATIYQAQVAKFGKAKVIMYPRSTGSGIRACGMVTSICNLAGIRDIGVKIHGTRNQRNIAKALITAFEAQTIPAEQPAVQRTAVPSKPTTKQMMHSLPQLARLLAASAA